MSYHDFSPEEWEAFQPQRCALLREQLEIARRRHEEDLARSIELTISAIELRAANSQLPWWRRWARQIGWRA